MERRGFNLAEKAIRYTTLEAQLMRIISPKYASYFGDGGGRDSYITVNNGGLSSSDKQHMMKRPFRPTLRDKEREASPKKPVMPVNYHSDGSGRDTYVISNSGGLTKDYGITHAPDVHFRATLRDSPRELVPWRKNLGRSPSGDITTYRNWADPRSLKTLERQASIARDVTLRLSPDRGQKRSISMLANPKAKPYARRLTEDRTAFNKTTANLVILGSPFYRKLQ